MKHLIRFRRLNRPTEVIDGVSVQTWEVAFSQRDLNAKLNGEVAEICMPAAPWYVRLWRICFPLTPLEGIIDMEPKMSFCGALLAMRDGFRVSRASWNGKGMWIVLMPALSLPPFSSQEPGAKVNDRTAKHIGVDTPLDSQPYFSMWTASGQWQPGWLPSAADILAEDWGILQPA